VKPGTIWGLFILIIRGFTGVIIVFWGFNFLTLVFLNALATPVSKGVLVVWGLGFGVWGRRHGGAASRGLRDK